MRTLLVLVLLLLGFKVKAQENKLALFDNLIDRTWYAEGSWGNGAEFKQEIAFRYDLGNTLVIAESKGFTNQEHTEYGPRNHGIRKYDSKTNTIQFWEFDVFGGITKGTVSSEEKNIHYTYSYGESMVTDMWEYVDDNTYNFKVGEYKNGKWTQTYLSTQFRAEPKGK